MISVLAVDLAALFSAAAVVDEGGEVLAQFDSRMFSSQSTFLGQICMTIVDYVPDYVVVEDVPHALRFDSGTKAACRMQGRLLDRLEMNGWLAQTVLIPPALWQRTFDGVWRAGPAGAAAAAKNLGYEPPNLLELERPAYDELHGKERQDVRAALQKRMTDYVDAYLIGRWAQNTLAAKGTLDVPSAQRYIP